MKWLLLLVLAPTASAQVVALNVGTSSLYEGSGALGTVYLPDSTATLSAGIEQGQFRYSLADSFKWRGLDWTVGDNQIYFVTGGVGLGWATRVPNSPAQVSIMLSSSGKGTSRIV